MTLPPAKLPGVEAPDQRAGALVGDDLRLIHRAFDLAAGWPLTAAQRVEAMAAAFGHDTLCGHLAALACAGSLKPNIRAALERLFE